MGASLDEILTAVRRPAPMDRAGIEARRTDYTAPRRSDAGPVAWCSQCSRYHERRKPCDLYLRKRTVNNANRRGRRKGRENNRVPRWCH